MQRPGDGQSAAHPIAPGHLMIRSLINGKLVRVFGFSLATNLAFRKNAGKVTLIGETDQHDFFNTGQVELGRYATRVEAEREVTMIESAMAAGEGTYHLQFALAPKEK
ncbi:hypothetical protein [Lacticaseibacillus yichunensis]|uniref:Uncharacterized protein n=1 Tax=Lacticaseibacillus yichunensis TaxID=2486015 RepID=A0ABW4CVC4_9LACO|nr:hypothetical protein [Lacticaseibacillus yichunensis]